MALILRSSGSPLTNDQIDGNFTYLRDNAGLTGDVVSTGNATTVNKINGVTLSGLATGILRNTTGTGAPVIAVAADFPTLNQNTTGSAATLTTSRNINGIAFNGSADITIKATATNILTFGTNLTGTSYDGSSAVTIGIGTAVALRADTTFIGTTSVALNRTSANLALTGILSVTMQGSTSGSVQLIPTAAVGTGTILTIPATTGTIVTTGDTGSVTNTMLSGSIANAKLTNSSLTVGTTTISLGSSSTTLTGLTSVTSTGFTGALTGNASTATTLATARNINGVSFNGSSDITIKATATNILTIGSGLTGTSYDGSSAVTVAIDSTVALKADTHFIGTTSVALNRTSANLALAGISSVTLPGSTSGTVQLVPVTAVGTGTILTIPATTGTIVTTGDSATVTNTMLAGSIANSKLTNSSLTVGTTSISLGSSSTTLAGLTSVTLAGSTSGTVQLNPTAISGTTVLTLPATTGTLVTTGDSATVTNTMLSGSIANAKLINSSLTVGTTSISLGGSSTTLAGLTSVTLSGSVSGTVQLIPVAAVGTGTVLTIPAVTGTIVTTGDTATVTNTMLAGSIANAKLVNSSLTVGTTAISLGSSSTTIAGLTSVTSTGFTGALTGNASTATTLATARNINGVSFNGSADITIKATATNLLTIGSGLTGTSYDGSSAVTVAIDSTVALRADTHYIGTTAVTLNRASANLALAGLLSVTMQGSTSGSVQLIPSAIAGTSTILTMPATSGTIVTTGDTGTVTNTMLAGSIANAKLTNSSLTVGTTSISLGSSSTTLTGLTSVTSTGFTGALTGNASTATKLLTSRTINGVAFDGTSDITIAVSLSGDVTGLATGIATFLATPTSANLATAVTDETGTGLLVFNTSPVISTSLSTASTSFALLNTNATTVNFAGAATALSMGASTGTSTVNNDLVVSGNLTVNGTTTTINTATLAVDDKNIELGAVPSATISTTGTVGTITGTGPWSAVITGMTSTTGLIVGSSLSATNGTGSLGGSGSYIVTSIDSKTQITYSATGGTTPTAGTITTITTTGYNNTTANGAGITVKGTTDKTLNWVGTTTAWTSSENLDIASGKSYLINGTSILSSSTLGSSVLASSLTSVGTLTSVSTSGQFISTAANNIATGGGQIYLNGATGNRIDFNINGTGAPTFTTRSVGTKIVLYPNVGVSNADFALGIESGAMWSSVAISTNQFKWYAGTTSVATLSGTGTFSTTNLDYTGTLTGGTGVIAIGTNQIYKDASGNVGIGTSLPAAKLDIVTPSALPTTAVPYGLSITNTSLKTYPTTSSFTAYPAFSQNIELGTSQTIDTTLGFNNVTGIRSSLTKSAGSTSDIERLYFNGFSQNFVWSDLNTCKQYVGIGDSFSYSGIDANTRVSAYLGAKTVNLNAPASGTQTVSTVVAEALTIRNTNANVTYNITSASGQTPNLSFSGTAGNITATIGTYTAVGLSTYWGSTLSGASSSATITNFYGLRLPPPSSSTNLTITNRWGVYADDALANNHFAGNVGIGTSNPAAKLDVAATIRSTANLTPSSGSGLEIIGGSSNNFIVAYNRTTPAFLPLELQSSLFTVATAGSERMRIDASGNVGIGNTPSGTYKLEVTGAISGTTLTSTIATGTAPFTVTSTTPVTNLSIGGNAATVTTIPTLSGEVSNSSNSITLSNSAVIGKVLTAYASSTGTISATDSILTAIQKLNGNTPIASSTTPAALGTAAVGTGTTFARADHVHTLPSLATLGAQAAGTYVTGVTGTAPVSSSGGTAPVISMAAATASVNGYMTSTYASKLDGIASSAIALSSAITGYVSGAGTVAATDSILTAIQKLNGNTPIASSTTPAALGTAAVGTGTTFARADHVHASPTTVSGNAGTATSIAGGVANNIPYQTAAGTTAFVPISTGAGQVLTTAAAGGAPTWVTPTGGTVTGVTGTSPIVSSGGTAPAISITAATTTVAGSMSAADKIKLDGVATGATNVTNTNQLTNGAGFITNAGTANGANYANNITFGSIGTIPYQSAANTTAMLAVGTAGQVLQSNAAAAPSWTTLSLESLPDDWVKKSCACATTAALTLNTAQTTVDGIVISATSRVLIKDQALASQNGIYTGVTTTTWVRATDADTISELAGASVNIDAGTVNGGKVFDTDLKTTDILGTTSISFYSFLDTSYLSSTTPAALGTAAVGTSTTLARADHVHQSPTTVSGNAGTATSIAGGVANNIPYQTAAGTTAFVPVSTAAGQVLTTAAAGGAPTWVTPTAITLSSAITGYVAGANTALAATDTILAAFGKLQGQVTARGVGTVTGVTGTAPVSSSGGTAPVISMAAATTSVPGYLTAADWTTFNGKQAALGTTANLQVNSIGVGTAAAATAGDIRATANITAYYTSDKRLKENIIPIENALEKIRQINGVNFDWTDEEIKARGGIDNYFVRKKDVGVIAQEIEKVLPEAVATRESGYKAVRYELLVPLLIEAIKEQQVQIDELKQTINKGN